MQKFCHSIILALLCAQSKTGITTGFVVPSGQLKASSSSATTVQSTRSPYETVGTSGASWNGAYWEGEGPNWDRHFAENRDIQSGRRPRYERTNTRTVDRRPSESFPRQRTSAPLVRYSDLNEADKAAVADPYSSSFSSRRPQNYGEFNQDHYGRSVPRPIDAQAIQGGSRSTWSTSPDGKYSQDRVQVTVETDGRPLQADVEVWQGPGNVPQKMRIFSEDGSLRPFTTNIETPGGSTTHSIHVKNTGPMEFPIIAGVQMAGPSSGSRQMPHSMGQDYNSARQYASLMGRKEEIHAGSLRTYAFDPSVGSVEVEIHSQGLPIMAIVELWQGPGDVKTIAQVYSDDGFNKPFSAILETPGSGNTIAIRNAGPEAYPFEAKLDVYRADDAAYCYSYDTNQRSYENNGRRF